MDGLSFHLAIFIQVIILVACDVRVTVRTENLPPTEDSATTTIGVSTDLSETTNIPNISTSNSSQFPKVTSVSISNVTTKATTQDPMCKYPPSLENRVGIQWYLCNCLPDKLCPAEDIMNETNKDRLLRHKQRKNTWIRVDMPTAVITLVLYSAMWILGVGGNILVIITIVRFLNKKSVTNIFLASLASADLMLLLLCLPVKASEFIYEAWLLGDVACKIVYYVRDVSFACSIMTLTAMCFERYFAICDPMKAHYISTPGRARKTVIVVWLLSFISVIPSLLIMETAPTEYDGEEVCRTANDIKILYMHLYANYLLGIFLVAPFVFMIYAYGRTCYELWVSTRNAQRMSGLRHPVESHLQSRWNTRSVKTVVRKGDDLLNRKRVIKMLIVVVLIFFFSWGPITLYTVISQFGVGLLKYYHIKQRLRLYLATLAYMNSCLNPVVYAFMSSHFRIGFKKCFYCFVKKRPRTKHGGHSTSDLRAHHNGSSVKSRVSYTESNTSMTTVQYSNQPQPNML